MTKPLIALCDGHGMDTLGKRTPVFPEGGVMKENEFNRAVVKYLDEELRRCGFRTLLVAPTDDDTPLSERVKKANQAGADFYLSVHANANTGKWGDWGGIETYTYPKGESLRIGKIIHKHLLKGTKLRDRGVKDGSHLYVIKNTKMPSVLVECGFMDNLEEARLLKSDAYRQECAVELAMALCEAYDIKYVPKSTSKNNNLNQNGKLFKVQVGSFSKKENAENLMKKIKSLGFDATVVKEGNLYKIQCGSFSNKENAVELEKKLKERGFETTIVSS